jgi:hypothetical protein
VSASDRQPNRRDFGQALVAAAVTPLLLSETADAQPVTDPATAIALALGEVARARFGKHLTDEQLKDVRRLIYRDQRGAELLHQVKLQNSDEPAVIFRANGS